MYRNFNFSNTIPPWNACFTPLNIPLPIQSGINTPFGEPTQASDSHSLHTHRPIFIPLPYVTLLCFYSYIYILEFLRKQAAIKCFKGHIYVTFYCQQDNEDSSNLSLDLYVITFTIHCRVQKNLHHRFDAICIALLIQEFSFNDFFFALS